MVDYERIGQRIQEQRKYLRKLSQEKMAADLMMYQADVSNMERGKPGSGIDNLDKLDRIAEYFDIPLETLIFGEKDASVIPYNKNRDSIRQITSKDPIKAAHKSALVNVAGCKEEELPVVVNKVYSSGDYTVYVMYEFLSDGSYTIYRCHLYTFHCSTLIANLVAACTSIRDYLTNDNINRLDDLSFWDILDVTDVLRTVNPFVPLFTFETDPEKQSEYVLKANRRTKILAPHASEPVLLIESVYVSENFRQKNVCRLMFDLLSLIYGDCTFWLNMEPTGENHITEEYSVHPVQTVAEVGQINLNAVIAEKLGLRISSDYWHRKAEVVDSAGNKTVQTIEIRKCAYRLSSAMKEIIKDDGNLVEIGYAKQRVAQKDDLPPEPPKGIIVKTKGDSFTAEFLRG